MDINQATLYINENLSGDGSNHPRFALEFKHFTEAIINNVGLPTMTPDMISKAWQRWKTERFEYVDTFCGFAEENINKLQASANTHVTEHEGKSLSDSERMQADLKTFKEAYSRQMQHIGLEPPKEHVLFAWNNWKRGHTF